MDSMHAHEAAQAFAERMHSTLPVLIVCVFIQMIFAAFDDDCLEKSQLKCKTTSECYYEFQVRVFFSSKIRTIFIMNFR